mmetsp:Transcript_7143/g.18032  ORF Transcript_7143/g.18032 Transcript_7143/m.18032 type:complete len:686 (+) Transcript_7143:82-2139(+)
MHSEGAGRDVRAPEELQGLLQRVDLGLAGGGTLLEGHALVYALGRQLRVVAVRGQQLVFRGLHVHGVRLKLGLGRGLVGFVQLDLLHLHRLVLVGLDGKALVSLGGRRLRGRGVRLQRGEVGGDDLQKRQHAVLRLVLLALLRLTEGLHALLVTRVDLALEARVRERVPLVGAHPHARLQAPSTGIGLQLDESRGDGCLRVEVLQDGGRGGDGLLRGLGVGDGRGVLGLLRHAQLRGLRHGLVQGLDLLGELGRLVRELQDEGIALLHGGAETVDVLAQLRAGDLALAHLRVAEALVAGVAVGLFEQARDHAVNHLLNLGEWVGHHLLGEKRQAVAVQELALRLEEVAHAAMDALGLALGVLATPELHERNALLRRGLRQGEVLLGSTEDLGRGEDFYGLADGLDLLGTQLLLLLEGHVLLQALRGHRREGLLVGGLECCLRGEHLLGLCLLLGLAGLLGALLLTLLVLVLDRVRQVHLDHVVGVLGIHLRLLDLAQLGAELVLQALEHLDNAARLEPVAVRLRCLVVRGAEGVLLVGRIDHTQEGRDDGLGPLRQAAALRELQERRGAVAVVVLFLQDRDCAVQSVVALGEVLLLLEEGGVVLRALVRRRLLVGLLGGDLVKQRRNALAEASDVAAELADAGCQALHLGAIAGDLFVKVRRLHRAPLLELRVCNLLNLLFLLRL